MDNKKRNIVITLIALLAIGFARLMKQKEMK